MVSRVCPLVESEQEHAFVPLDDVVHQRSCLELVLCFLGRDFPLGEFRSAALWRRPFRAEAQVFCVFAGPFGRREPLWFFRGRVDEYDHGLRLPVDVEYQFPMERGPVGPRAFLARYPARSE